MLVSKSVEQQTRRAARTGSGLSRVTLEGVSAPRATAAVNDRSMVVSSFIFEYLQTRSEDVRCLAKNGGMIIR